MGAGQVGGFATLLDIDLKNAAGFLGTQAEQSEAQFVVHYLSHALMFCMGTLIEGHVVLTPAICVYGERYKFDVYAGTHKFLQHAGVERRVEHLCIHRAYNHTNRWSTCGSANLALLVLSKQFSFHQLEPGADFVVNRLRYGALLNDLTRDVSSAHCRYYGWGSRRNGFLIPLLINLRRMDVHILPQDQCNKIWNYDSKFLCIQQRPCKSKKYGALCPDDLGSVIECSGFAVAMMISRLVDRPCGVGFLNLSLYHKFLTCGVDDARDVIEHDTYMEFDFTTISVPPTPEVITVPETDSSGEKTDGNKHGQNDDDKDAGRAGKDAGYASDAGKDARHAGKDASHAGKGAGNAGKDAGHASKDAGHAGKDVDHAGKDADHAGKDTTTTSTSTTTTTTKPTT